MDSSFLNITSIILPANCDIGGLPLQKPEQCVLVTRKTSSSDWFIHLFPIVFLVGVIGNFLAVIVLKRKAMQTTCSSIYLLVLALADTTVLCLSGFKTWLKLATGFELLHTSDYSCRLILYGFYSATHISAWIIVLVTAERLLAVHWPLKAGHTWLVRRPIRTVLVLVIVILVINSNILYTAELAYYVTPSVSLNYSSEKFDKNVNSNSSSCRNMTLKCLFCSAKRNTLITNINLFIYSLLPSLLLFSFNVAIIRTTKIVTSLFSTHLSTIHDKQCSSDQTGDCSGRNIPDFIQTNKLGDTRIENVSVKPLCDKFMSPHHGCRNAGLHTNSSPVNQKHVIVIRHGAVNRRSKECSQQRLTLTLLILSFSWLIFSFPYSLIDSEMRLFNKEANSRLICYFLMYVNHAVNFYLYCFLRQKFRNELKRCFARRFQIKGSKNNRRSCVSCFSVKQTPDEHCGKNLRRKLSLGKELVAIDTKRQHHVDKVIQEGLEAATERRKTSFNDFAMMDCPIEPQPNDEEDLSSKIFNSRFGADGTRNAASSERVDDKR